MESVLRPIQTPIKKNNTIVLIITTVIIVLAGIGMGYLLSGSGKGVSATSKTGTITANKNEAGITDESKFGTTTDGILTEGGIGGEGMYHLVRGSGPSQYAYLTSSAVDMSAFLGKKVQVWGETMSGKKAGWLIDVGKIKVLEGE